MHLSQLIKKAKLGDTEAAAELLEKYRNYMLLLAQLQLDKSLKSKLDPSDLVQESFLAVCRDLTQFRGETEQELTAWLRRIMANVCLKMVRTYKGTQRRNIALEQEFAAELDRSTAALAGLAAPMSSPSRIAIRREAAVLLADKLAELPDHYRRAIVMHHIEGLSIAQVAQHFHRSPEATNALLARALVKLRLLMKGTA